MKNLPIYLWTIVFLCISYAALNFVLFLRFKVLLKNANLVTFKKILGGNYQFRTQTNGLIKYKWRILSMIIKASFDSHGRLREWKIKPVTSFPFILSRFTT